MSAPPGYRVGPILCFSCVAIATAPLQKLLVELKKHPA